MNIKMLSTKFFTIFAILLFLFSAKNLPAEEKAPNFIIIYVDDMGYSDVGKISDGELNTPNINNLEKDGQTWTNFYAAASVCSPSRGAIMTGRLPINTGLYGDKISVFFPGSSSGIPHDLTTLPEVFQKNNYSTGLFGKWHLGDMKEFYPTRHGFDEWIGIPYSNDMDWTIDDINSTNIFVPWEESGKKWSKVSKPLREKIYNPTITDWKVPLIKSRKMGNNSYDDKILEQPLKQSLATARFTQEALNFIKRNTKQKKNFFLLLSHSMPHVPLFVSEQFKKSSPKGIYGDVIQEIDWSVGEIIKMLEKLDLVSNTYVIFTSDNGPWLAYKEHAGNSKPLRDGKGTTFEGGMRVVTYFYGANVKPGIINDLGVQTDFFNTLTSLASINHKISLPNSFELSKSLTNKNKGTRVFVPFFSGSELRAFRLNDQKVHFVTQGAFGAPPARKIQNPPLVIDLNSNIHEDLDLGQPLPESSDVWRIVDQFKASLEYQEPIMDQQFQHLLVK